MDRLLQTLAIIVGLAAFGLFTAQGVLLWAPPLASPSLSWTDRWDYALSKLGRRNDIWCLTRLERLDVAVVPQDAFTRAGGCGLRNGVRATRLGTAHLAGRPLMTCRLTEALSHWERRHLQPLAQAHLGSKVAEILHLGTYNCRKVRGSRTRLSQHATANAIDISGFVLADGRRISVERDWGEETAAGSFLRALTGPTRRAFSVVLTPDRGGLHANHMHLDMTCWRGGPW